MFFILKSKNFVIYCSVVWSILPMLLCNLRKIYEMNKWEVVCFLLVRRYAYWQTLSKDGDKEANTVSVFVILVSRLQGMML